MPGFGPGAGSDKWCVGVLSARAESVKSARLFFSVFPAPHAAGAGATAMRPLSAFLFLALATATAAAPPPSLPRNAVVTTVPGSPPWALLNLWRQRRVTVACGPGQVREEREGVERGSHRCAHGRFF